VTPRIERIVTSGTFSLDGGAWDVDNNVWLVGDDEELIIIDPAHSADAILQALHSRRVVAIVCTHGHNDHIGQALTIAEWTGSPILLHPADAPLWGMTHPSRYPDVDLYDGKVITVAGVDLEVLHTPGHSPGSVCLYAAALGAVFTGDTLFAGGPGATGRSFSDFPTIIDSIKHRLLTLPPDTVLHTGHGDDTTVGAEAPHLDDWVVRGY